MNEEPTKDLPGKKSFEERVFARFDAMDARLESLEARSHDTKPIWEKALTAIVETGKEVTAIKNRVTVIERALASLSTDVSSLKTDMSVLKSDVAVLKSDVSVLKSDVSVLKTDVAGLDKNFGGMKNEFVDIRRELRENVRNELALILKHLIEDRQDIRDAEDRIRQLETKLA